MRSLLRAYAILSEWLEQMSQIPDADKKIDKWMPLGYMVIDIQKPYLLISFCIAVMLSIGILCFIFS